MSTYIVRRVLIAIPIFFGITILVFLFLVLAPGDPVSAFIRPELANNDPAMRQIIIERYGLDQPLPVRYLRWLARGCPGQPRLQVRRRRAPRAGHRGARARRFASC